jgi:tRNA(Ile)-lysidine synthase
MGYHVGMSRDHGLENAVAAVPPGAWAVGVSGGADSVALLLLLAARPDLRLHAVHLDHQTRGRHSTADARFVDDLCARVNIARTIARRDQIEPTVSSLPDNPSARYRALRLELFRRACESHNLLGVILAHHADDQAETLFQRLLKGSAPAGLTGMRADTTVAGLRILRPLLGIRAAALRTWLTSQRQTWREDASNTSPAYQRNRVRGVLQNNDALSRAIVDMGEAMRALVDWSRDTAPIFPESFPATDLAHLPDVLATESARRWLTDRGAPADELSPSVLVRLIDMARDAATPPRQDFPGPVHVRRAGGRISASA